MLDFLTDEMRRDPYPLFARARSDFPVLHEPNADMWLLFDYDSVKRALNDHEAFSSVVETPTGKAPDWLVFTDPPRHSKLRGIIMRAFTPRSIASLEPRVRELSRELLAPVLERGELDLVADYASPLPMIVIAELLGIPVADRQRFMHWAEVIMKLSYTVSGGEEAARALSENAVVKEEMRAYFNDLASQRREAPKDDLLTRLVQAEVDGERLTPNEFLGFFQLLLSAGTETTTHLIANAMLCLLEHPDPLARLRAEPGLLPSAIEEVLRYRTPAQMVYRTTRTEVELRGQRIPSGKLVLVMVGSANRDATKFEDAERFDITRDPNPHIAFGHGLHYCLGAALSRLEARVALPDLLEHLKDVRLASAEPWAPRKALNVLGPASLPLRFEPVKRAAAGA
ncbi:cytochrome P450 [Pyxidicoccus fallax]|uniref:Cytochrome P450 n=1 Tax=Pyxidicoccus fallax TaxID=394095 RepID=A0A848LJF1_9BACT|nr:cytochrome P450 [Pyxidicoccus fallax]NMO17842.1 cytochrome P450 [Pyxidicoccus fallax]NPC82279.1 cytochrome P450 [Pyxidicoccus fallax]